MPGIDVDAFTEMESAGRASGEDGQSRSTTDRQRKWAYGHRGQRGETEFGICTTPAFFWPKVPRCSPPLIQLVNGM